MDLWAGHPLQIGALSAVSGPRTHLPRSSNPLAWVLWESDTKNNIIAMSSSLNCPQPSQRERGGWRQRHLHEQERSRSPVGRSYSGEHLLRFWLSEWAWGFLSSAKLGLSCAAGLEDGLNHPMLRKLARTASGHSSHNIHRQILNLFGAEETGDLIASIPDSSVDSFVFPHDIFALFSRRPAAFKFHLGADPAVLSRFWSEFGSTAAGRAFMNAHPNIGSRDDLHYVIPLFVHIDGFPITRTRKRKATVLQWGSLVGHGSDKQAMFTCASWPGGVTALPNLAWDWLGFDWETLSSGTFPHRSPTLEPYVACSLRGERAGKPFAPAGGSCYKAVFMFLTGDCEMFCNEIGLPSYNSNKVCGLCGCNRTGAPWCDFRRCAMWRRDIYGTPSLLACRTKPLHGFWAWSGVQARSIALDSMHMIDHHGVGGDAIGNLFYEAIRKKEIPGRTFDDSLQELNRQMSDFNRTYGVEHHLPTLTMENLTDATEYPTLKGPGIKAAMVKGTYKFAVSLARRLDDGSPYKRRRREVLECIDAMSDMIDTSPLHWSSELLSKFKTHVYKLQVKWTWLAAAAAGQGEQYWMVRPKLHYIGHLELQAELLSPRATRCYLMESSVGKVQRQYASSINGPFAAGLQRTILIKSLVALSLWLAQFKD